MLNKIMLFKSIFVTGYTITYVGWLAELYRIIYGIKFCIMYGSDRKGSAIFLLTLCAP